MKILAIISYWLTESKSKLKMEWQMLASNWRWVEDYFKNLLTIQLCIKYLKTIQRGMDPLTQVDLFPLKRNNLLKIKKENEDYVDL